MKRFLIIALLIFLVFGCSKQVSNDEVQVTTTTTTKATTTIKKPLVGKYIELSISECFEKIKNDETFLMYFGSNTCSHCQKFKDELMNSILVNQPIEIYAVISIAGNATAEEALLASFLKIEVTPTTYVIKNGEVVEAVTGSVDEETLLKLYNRLTE